MPGKGNSIPSPDWYWKCYEFVDLIIGVVEMGHFKKNYISQKQHYLKKKIIGKPIKVFEGEISRVNDEED